MRRAEYFPKSIQREIDQLQNQNVLDTIAQNITSQNALLAEAWRDLGSASGQELWDRALLEFRELVRIIYESDEGAVHPDVQSKLNEVNLIFMNGARRGPKIQNIRRIMLEMGELSRVEITRLEKAGQFITAQAAMRREAGLVAIIKRHVKDQKILDAIADDMDATRDDLLKGAYSTPSSILA